VLNLPGIAGLLPASVSTEELWGPGDPATLDRSEEECTAGFAERRMQEFAAGRRCSRLALGQLGHEPSPLLVGREREPLWPPGFTGSITHTRRYCAAAVCHKGAIASLGLDVENVADVEPDLWPVFCTATELAWLAGLPLRLRGGMATVIYSGKESYFKCQFPLLRRHPDFLDVELALKPRTFAVMTRNAPAGFDFEGTYAALGDFGMVATAVVGRRSRAVSWAAAAAEYRGPSSPSWRDPLPGTR
jgi:4'-phosphopantetheinyl transferase EntD